MEAYLNKSIKEVIKEFPPVEKILDEYGIGCGPCAVGLCLLKDIVSIHNLPADQEQEMMGRIAELMLVNRPVLGLRLSMTSVAARIVAAIAGEDPELVLPLMEGLQGDLLPADDRAADLLKVHLHTYDSAVEHALSEWEEHERLAAR